jgi:hypothetical protein
MRRVITLALIGGLAATLSACDSIKSDAGFGKDSPDEFAVVTKAPLVIPPDFNLHPPAPGAAAANQVEPTQAAQAALFAADPNTVAASLPANMSMGERYLLANARVQDADPGIRQQIAADAGNLRGSDDSFTDALLFSGSSSTPPGSTPVDADAEARRLEAARAAGASTAPQAPVGSASAPPPPPEKKSDSPWYWPF